MAIDKNETFENKENTRRLQRRRASASKRRAARRQSGLDFMEVENLSMPAVTKMKSRTERRDNRLKEDYTEPARSWKDQSKARSQWARHMDLPCRRHVNPKSQQAERVAKLRTENPLSLA